MNVELYHGLVSFYSQLSFCYFTIFIRIFTAISMASYCGTFICILLHLFFWLRVISICLLFQVSLKLLSVCFTSSASIATSDDVVVSGKADYQSSNVINIESKDELLHPNILLGIQTLMLRYYTLLCCSSSTSLQVLGDCIADLSLQIIFNACYFLTQQTFIFRYSKSHLDSRLLFFLETSSLSPPKRAAI